jgi:hypothetical protein
VFPGFALCAIMLVKLLSFGLWALNAKMSRAQFARLFLF